MIIRENKKYFLIEKTILSMILGWSFVLFIIFIIADSFSIPIQYRSGLYGIFDRKMDLLSNRIDQVEFNQKIYEYLLFNAKNTKVNWREDIDHNIVTWTNP